MTVNFNKNLFSYKCQLSNKEKSIRSNKVFNIIKKVYNRKQYIKQRKKT